MGEGYLHDFVRLSRHGRCRPREVVGETSEASVESVQQAVLSPGWSWSTGVNLLSYYDARAIARTDPTSGHVTQWSNQVSTDYVSNTGSQGPLPNANAFGSGMDGLDFNGSELLRDTSWSGPPLGTSAPYTVLVIAKSIAPQTSSVVAWWSPANYDAVRCQLAPSGSNTFMQESRTYNISGDQLFTGSTNVTSSSAHALGWLYTPEVLRTFVDGTTEASSTLSALPAISYATTFLIGARSDLPTQLSRAPSAKSTSSTATLAPRTSATSTLTHRLTGASPDLICPRRPRSQAHRASLGRFSGHLRRFETEAAGRPENPQHKCLRASRRRRCGHLRKLRLPRRARADPRP